jgi:hypothetical protein
MSTADDGRFNKTMVFRRNQNAMAGYLVDVESDTLILLSGGRQEKVPRQDLLKVVVDVEKNPETIGAYGMLFGVYLGNFIFFTAKKQPPAYFDSDDFRDSALGTLLANIAFATAGGLLGYLANATFEKEKAFDFTGPAPKQQAEWQRLHKFSRREKSARKVHLSVQAAHVYTRVSSRYTTVLRDAGFTSGNQGFYFEDGELEPASDFNLLRKLQLTVSLRPETEIGVAVAWLGEPTISAFKLNVDYLQQSLKATGYYVVGIYNPFRTRLQKRNIWHVGLGLGAANMEFKLRARYNVVAPTFSQVTVGYAITKTLVSGVIFTGLQLYPSNNLSLGLSADYVFMPTEQAAALPELRIPAQKLRLGNGSLGFAIGLHF